MASNSVCDAIPEGSVPVRATYLNLYKWPESDAKFVKSMTSKCGQDNMIAYGRYEYLGKRLDSFAGRQMFLRSYPLSKGEDHNTTIKCFGSRANKDSKAAAMEDSRKRMLRSGGGRRKCSGFRRVKDATSTIFQRWCLAPPRSLTDAVYGL